MARRIFDPREREEVVRAFRVAEDLIGDHFALAAIDSHRHPVDLRTLVELRAEEVVPEGALAQVARYDQRDSIASLARTLYRICLQDHAVLGRLREERGAVALFPLLVYVLTHELVHVVRFLRHQGPFHASDRERAAEEAIVHEITQRVLHRAPLPALRPVLDRFRPFGLPSLDDLDAAERLYRALRVPT
jgi:hypothetical protein